MTSEKTALRRRIRAARKQAAADLPPGEAGGRLVQHSRAVGPLAKSATVAGYWPVASEMDPRPLMEHWRAAGHPLCLPYSRQRGAPLEFRPYAPGAALAPDAVGIPSPLIDAPLLLPDIIMVPLLGFDRSGGRLGNGAGFYDISLAALRAERGVLAIGIAYAVQESADLPVETHDQPLDWVLTESEAIKCR